MSERGEGQAAGTGSLFGGRIPAGAEGADEFARLMHELLRAYAVRQRLQYSAMRHQFPATGLHADGLLVADAVARDAIAVVFAWSGAERPDLDLPRTPSVDEPELLPAHSGLHQFRPRGVIVLDPHEDGAALPALPDLPADEAVHRWGMRQVESLLRLCPPLFARYRPEPARPLLSGYDGFDFREFASRYREQVASAFEHVRLLGFPPEVLRERDARADIRLRDLFVSTRFVDDDEKAEARELVDLLQQRRSAVVLGDPGMGKSTLLAYLALLHAGGAELPGYAPPEARLPLFISLRDYVREQQNGDLSLLDYLALRARTDRCLANAHPAFFEATLRMGEAIILLDGLDEVGGSATRTRLADRIRAFRSLYDRCPIWVTSRIHGYTQDIALPRDAFAHVRIGPLDDARVDDYLARWYAIQYPDNPREREERKASLRRAVFRTPPVRRLAGNPLLLTLMAFVHRFLGDLPQDRGELYEHCVQMLLHTWQQGKRMPGDAVERHPFERLALPVETQREYLEALAHDVQGRSGGGIADDVRGLFSRDDARELLADLHCEYVQRSRPEVTKAIARGEMHEFIDYIGDRVGLLVDRGGGKLSFLHLSFQEYLAASAETDTADEDEQCDFFRAHIGDPAWEEVLLLRLYILSRKRRRAGQRLFDTIITEILSALDSQPEHPGWLTLGRALRDRLSVHRNHQRPVIEKVLGAWLRAPRFEGAAFVVLEDVVQFALDEVKAELRAACARVQAEGSPGDAVAALHLEPKLFGGMEGAADRLRSRKDLHALLPDLVVFLDDPGFAVLLAENARAEHWEAAFAVIDAGAVHRATLRWATGLTACPVEGAAPLLGAARWVRGRIGAEVASRNAYGSWYAAEDVRMLRASPGTLRLVDEPLHRIEAPLAFVHVPDALADVRPPARPAPLLLREELAHQRWTPGSEPTVHDAPLVDWAVRFIQTHVGEHVTSLPADALHAVAVSFVQGFLRDFVRTFVLEFERDITRHYGRALVLSNSRAFILRVGPDFVRDIGREFGLQFGDDVVRDAVQIFEENFGFAFVREFGRDAGRALGRVYGHDFVRWRLGALLRNVGVEPDAPDWEGQWILAVDRKENVTRILESHEFWWLVFWRAPPLYAEPGEARRVLESCIGNPLALPLLLADLGALAAAAWFVALGRHMHVLHPDGEFPDEAWETWLADHPIDAFFTALAWDEYAKLIQQHHGRLEGPAGALALAHADYASLMTGLDLAEGTVWKGLLDAAGPEKIAALRNLASAPAPAPASAPIPASAAAPAPIPVPAPAPLFTWLHLSDLHFGLPRAADRHNQSQVLAALRDDLANLTDRALPRPDVLLVTGDIAWSGKPDQYAEASQWLRDIASRLGLDPTRIFVVPGNHDIDRDADKERNTKRLVRALRSGDDDLDDALENPADRDLLLQRKQAYLEFARQFAPACLAPFWTHRLTTRGNLSVRLAGLDTALLAADTDDREKLRLGQRQLALLNDAAPERELVLVLGHHPFEEDWLADERDAEVAVRRRAHAYLAGHVHSHRTERRIFGGGGDLVRIVAGAVYGGRAHEIPEGHAYSIGALLPGPDSAAPLLRIYPRRFSFKNGDFRTDVDNVPEGRACAEHRLERLSLPRPQNS